MTITVGGDHGDGGDLNRIAEPARIREVLTIRSNRPADFDELWRIDQACFAAGIAYSRRELAWYMRRSRAFTLVAEQEEDSANHIAGFIVAESDPSGAGHILTIDVHPRFQRADVGSRLLAAAEQRLVEEGGRSVLLETAVDNLAAIAFYKKHGYLIIETLPRYYMNSIDALVMGKHLK
jgi:ribosomal-protein-alanine N-acetyltransferase